MINEKFEEWFAYRFPDLDTNLTEASKAKKNMHFGWNALYNELEHLAYFVEITDTKHEAVIVDGESADYYKVQNKPMRKLYAFKH